MKKIFTLFLFVLFTLCVSMLHAGTGLQPGKLKSDKHIQLPERLQPLTKHQPPSAGVNSGVFKPAWETIFYWDDAYSEWYINDSIRYTYNSAGNPTVALKYDNTGAITYRMTHYYNGNQKLTLTVDESWNGTGWDSVYQEMYTYNGNSQLTQDLFIIWNSTAWENWNMYVYSYGPYGLTQELNQSWNGTSWDNKDAYTYAYNGSGQVISDTSKTWNAGSWDYVEKQNYSYDVNGHIKGDLISVWQSGMWVKNDSLVNVVWYQWAGFNNDNSKLGNYLVQAWDDVGKSWHDSSRVTFTYDAYANQSDYVVEDWDQGMSMWMQSDEIKNILFLDGNNNITQNIEQDWDASTFSLYNYQKWNYGGYSFYTNVNDPKAKGGLVVYPSPSDGEINIVLPDLNFKIGHLAVISSIGEEVYSENIIPGNGLIKTIPLHASAGIYFVKINSGEKEFSQKIILK